MSSDSATVSYEPSSTGKGRFLIECDSIPDEMIAVALVKMSTPPINGPGQKNPGLGMGFKGDCGRP